MVHAIKMVWYMVVTQSWNSRWLPQACTQDQTITKLMLPVTILLATLCDVQISLSLSLSISWNTEKIKVLSYTSMGCPVKKSMAEDTI